MTLYHHHYVARRGLALAWSDQLALFEIELTATRFAISLKASHVYAFRRHAYILCNRLNSPRVIRTRPRL